MPLIHPTAVVEDGAEIADNVVIGPYSVVSKGVVLEDGVVVKAHVYLDGNTRIGQNSVIWPGAVIGTKPQDLKYKGETTYVNIGPKCEIRECVTINSSCGEGSVVSLGQGCLIMAYSHIAHNCELGNGVIMANNATLAGHVIVEDCAVIGGLSAVHQFARVGKMSMVGGMSRVSKDVLPYSLGAGSPFRVAGLNRVGLQRRGVPFPTRMALAKAFRLIYRSGFTLEEALLAIERDIENLPEVQHVIEFCRSTKRGLIIDDRTHRGEEE
jgi:UDP-N-acetylglucosamine acyltransferase